MKGWTGRYEARVFESTESNDLDVRWSQIFMAGQQRKCPYKRVRTLVVTKAEPLIPYLANTSIAKASA